MSFFKKAIKSAVKASVGAVKATIINPAVQSVKALGDISRGDTEGLLNRGSSFLKDSARDARSVLANTANATYELGGKQDLFGGTSVKSSTEINKEKSNFLMASEQKKLSDIEEARPELERQSLFNKQYQNSLLKSGGRKYNTLLGGGF